MVQKMVRKSGVLLPLTALPSKYGIGDLGPEAIRFAEFLKKAGQRAWQVLPLTVVDGGSGNSPYSPPSAFAGNPLLISPEVMLTSGLLDRDDLKDIPEFAPGKIDYDLVRASRRTLLQRAWINFKNSGRRAEFDDFVATNRHWLESYSFFAAIKEDRGGQSWHDWPEDLRFRRHEALHRTWESMADVIEYYRFVQFVFRSQVMSLRECLNLFEIEFIGDMPIYVTLDSADVWANPHLFELNDQLKPISVAGVPPDYYSSTGQLWGNPLYRWDAMESDGFRWWMDRLRHLLSFFDKIRMDHFRGLIGYWAIPADALTAEKGCWRGVPHERFFEHLCRDFPDRPFLAENLGILSSDIEAARRGMGLPGMLVLHFAFGDPSYNPYAPHNHTPDNVVYTGTHDNNTSLGWFEEEATSKEISNLILYIGREITRDTICGDMIRMAMGSVAETAVVQMQDYLELGAKSRINIPSTPIGNWTWRMTSSQITDELATRMKEITKLYGRLPTDAAME
ncbi:MAG: 4-alpha-glucanotransferase [Synergistaceae bacterium]|jgi:4-alpha-glucanotransferase|nr:4-alpha-glucanotransferase [Synergistaceae bacterium]